MGAERSYAAECGVHVVFVRAVPRPRNGTFFLDANVIALAIRSPTCTFISTPIFVDDSVQWLTRSDWTLHCEVFNWEKVRGRSVRWTA